MTASHPFVPVSTRPIADAR